MSAIRLAPVLLLLASSLPAAAQDFSGIPGAVDDLGMISFTELTAEALSETDTDSEVFTVFPTGSGSAEAITRASGFASALVQSNGNLEVGAALFRAGSTTATAVFDKFLENDRLDPANLGFRFSVPGGRVTVSPGFANAFVAPRAGVLVQFTYDVAGGPLQTAFEFGVDVKSVFGGVDIEPLGPIVTRPLTNFFGRVIGVEIDPFEGTVLFPELPVNEVLNFTYRVSAFGSTGITEFGYEAFLGDPLDAFAGGGGQVFLASAPPPPGPVPEPAAVLLLGLGLAALATVRYSRGRSAASAKG